MSGVVDPTTYAINTQFHVQDHVPGLDRFTSRIGGVFGGLRDRLTGSLGSALAAAGVSAGIGVITQKVIGLHTELQNAQLGVASLVSALTHTDMASSLKIARAEVKLLQKDAAAGAGGLQDYIQGFQTIFAPATSAGADLDRIRNLNRLALAAGFAMRGKEGLHLAPMDVQQALTGGVGDRTTPIVNQALRAIGVTNQKFNAMSPAKQLETLEKAFGTFSEAAEVMGQSWDARLSTLQDRLSGIARQVTEPLFDRWSEQLGQANDWLQRNSDMVDEIADKIGTRLVSAYDKVSGLATGSLGGGVLGGLGAARLAGATGIGASAGAPLVALGAVIGNAAAKWPEDAAKAVGSLSMLTDSMSNFGTSLYALFVDNPIMSGIGRGIINFTTAFSTGMSIFIDLLTVVSNFLIDLTSMAGMGLTAWKQLLTGDFSGFKKTVKGQEAAFGEAYDRATKQLREIGKREIPKDKPKDDEPPPVTGNTTNIYGPVSVKVEAERLDDPNTVATTMEKAFRRIAEYPRGRAGRLVPKPG